MRMTWRLLLAFVLVALFAAGITGLLGYRAAQGNVQRFLREQGLTEMPSPEMRPPREFGQFRGPPPLRDRQQLLARLRTSLAQSALLAAIGALLVGSYLAYRFVRPIRSLTQVNRRYAGGERSARAHIHSQDEIAELGQAFNALADQLSAEQDRQKQMLADIAHELRTPLTILRGELEAMQDGLMEANPGNLGRLIEEIDLLTRLVQDLRLLTIAEAGALELKRVPTTLATLAQESASLFQTKAEARGITLESQLQPITLNADPERLKQVLYNLLENALRHTPAGGSVRLSSRQEGPWGVLEVADTGSGIPQADLAHVFDRFYRADQARSRETGGSGLGLAIAKALVQAHQGQISAQNRPQGGARIVVRLPLNS